MKSGQSSTGVKMAVPPQLTAAGPKTSASLSSLFANNNNDTSFSSSSFIPPPAPASNGRVLPWRPPHREADAVNAGTSTHTGRRYTEPTSNSTSALSASLQRALSGAASSNKTADGRPPVSSYLPRPANSTHSNGSPSKTFGKTQAANAAAVSVNLPTEHKMYRQSSIFVALPTQPAESASTVSPASSYASSTVNNSNKQNDKTRRSSGASTASSSNDDASSSSSTRKADDRTSENFVLRRQHTEVGLSAHWNSRGEASSYVNKAAAFYGFNKMAAEAGKQQATQLLKSTPGDPPTLGKGPHISQAICKVRDPTGGDCYGFLFVMPIANGHRHGLMTLKHAASLGPHRVRRSWNLLIHFEASFRPEKPIEIPFQRWIIAKKLGVAFFELPPQAVEYVQFKKLEFLHLFPGRLADQQRMMALRSATNSKQPFCAVGEIGRVDEDGHFKHKISALPGLPILDPITFTVIGVQKGADFSGNELASGMRAAIAEMAPEEPSNWTMALPEEIPPPTTESNTKPQTEEAKKQPQSNNTQPSAPTEKLVANVIRSLAWRGKKTQNLELIRFSKLIPEHFKDEICDTTSRYNLTADELAMKSDSDLRLLFPRRDIQESVFNWKRSIQVDCWRREKLASEAERLHAAVKAGNVDMVRAILFDKTIPPGCRPLLVEHRDPNNQRNTPLLQAALNGSANIAYLLLFECNANAYIRDAHELESMPIHLAAAYGHYEIVAMLLDAKPDLLEAKNRHNDTPLNRAAARGRLLVTQFLVDKRFANFENRGEYGRTPLQMAAAWGHLAIVEFLAERGADVFAKDSETASTAIHLAAYFGQANVVDYLISRHQGLASVRNKFGKTAWAWAKSMQKKNVTKVLESRGANIE